ncbi:MAG: nuclear transport factor 2 family protein [Crocinitomicaceae bacterium]
MKKLRNKFLLGFIFLIGFQKYNCQSRITDTLYLNTVINQWHLDAANARLEEYFSVMSEDFVFLGTAPGERWSKSQFFSFCKPYFDVGKAWDFKPSNRNWHIDYKRKIAWFDEDLSTWMEGCRGSGICIFYKGGVKIAYYNLTVLIENEKIQPFIELRKQ